MGDSTNIIKIQAISLNLIAKSSEKKWVNLNKEIEIGRETLKQPLDKLEIEVSFKESAHILPSFSNMVQFQQYGMRNVKLKSIKTVFIPLTAIFNKLFFPNDPNQEFDTLFADWDKKTSKVIL